MFECSSWKKTTIKNEPLLFHNAGSITRTSFTSVLVNWMMKVQNSTLSPKLCPSFQNGCYKTKRFDRCVRK